jgi:hypothetical protein
LPDRVSTITTGESRERLAKTQAEFGRLTGIDAVTLEELEHRWFLPSWLQDRYLRLLLRRERASTCINAPSERKCMLTPFPRCCHFRA